MYPRYSKHPPIGTAGFILLAIFVCVVLSGVIITMSLSRGEHNTTDSVTSTTTPRNTTDTDASEAVEAPTAMPQATSTPKLKDTVNVKAPTTHTTTPPPPAAIPSTPTTRDPESIKYGSEVADFLLKESTLGGFTQHASTEYASGGFTSWDESRQSLRMTSTADTPAWIKFGAEITEPIDSLQFDYQFSNAGENGYLSVHVDGVMIYSTRQEYSGVDKITSEQIGFGMLGGGQHFLAFRLDSLESGPATVDISNIKVGSVYIDYYTNVIPVAVISAVPQRVNVGTPLILDGSDSYDPDDGPTPMKHIWHQISGPTAKPSLEHSSVTTVTPTVPGTYTYGLYVSDTYDSDTAEVTFVVE